MLSTKSITAAALSAVALSGVCASSAAADSISYLKDGNVWLATSDGSRQFQVTDTGGYTSASQADNGTIVALKGQRIHKLDRLGNVLADSSTAVSDGENDDKLPYASHFVGPHEVDLSPDGTKVAYNWHWQYWTTFGSTTGYHMLRQGVGVAATDRTTGWEEPGMGYQTGWLDSAWYDDDTLAYGNKASAGMIDIAVNDVGRQNTGSQDWFKSDAGTLSDMRSPAVSPDKSLVAIVGDSSGANPYGAGEQLWTVASGGEAPAEPTGFCNGYIGPEGGTFSSPTFSPDGRSLAWAEGDGIHVAAGQKECGAGQDARLVIPGGKDPDWSAAGVPTSRPVKEQPGGGTPPATGGETGRPGPNGTAGPITNGTPSVLPGALTGTPAPSRQSAPSARGTAAKPALTLSFACRRTCTVSGKVVASKALGRKLKVGGSALATGTARRSAKGKVVLKLRLTAKGRKAATRLKGRKLTLRVAIKEAGKTRRLTKTVKLVR